ncbi:hypothetical protein NDU88_001267 [Pleurodeles waltl]|uniref:Uncharacterized protein n=1 Tax=Pleurodeles waltl TaxID=8319 RepID=A0AAV7LH02_PLEWA|nr:hypothetical protein NDU88_001267 [Pleurodeles waltl]
MNISSGLLGYNCLRAMVGLAQCQKAQQVGWLSTNHNWLNIKQIISAKTVGTKTSGPKPASVPKSTVTTVSKEAIKPLVHRLQEEIDARQRHLAIHPQTGKIIARPPGAASHPPKGQFFFPGSTG